MSDIITNKVTESVLVTINLEDYYPKETVEVFDLKDYLFMGLILKEKDFRESLKNLDINTFSQKIVTVTCSTDAIIPVWAYMLVTSLLQPVAREIYYGTAAEASTKQLIANIAQIKVQEYAEKRVVIKGCGELPIGEAAYLEATKVLRPVVKSIMYGEPCSTVPIFKRK
jgi:hypothetical protein